MHIVRTAVETQKTVSMTEALVGREKTGKAANGGEICRAAKDEGRAKGTTRAGDQRLRILSGTLSIILRFPTCRSGLQASRTEGVQVLYDWQHAVRDCTTAIRVCGALLQMRSSWLHNDRQRDRTHASLWCLVGVHSQVVWTPLPFFAAEILGTR